MRADVFLVDFGHATTRSQAQRLIAAGVEWRLSPLAPWQKVAKNGDDIPSVAEVRLLDDAEAKYISRGGLKLEGALRATGLAVTGLRCLDVGQSTGGFTDCLLQRGAAHVVAVDVGRAQIHARLLADERVTSWESTNVGDVAHSQLAAVPGYAEGASVVVADLSFVSLAVMVPALVDLAAPAADLVVMVKPQFEASRQDVPAGGVVEDVDVQRRAVDAVAQALADVGCEVRAMCESPITGTEGNREFFLWAVRGSTTHRQR